MHNRYIHVIFCFQKIKTNTFIDIYDIQYTYSLCIFPTNSIAMSTVIKQGFCL
jgi:hypothetical protein